MWVVSYIDLPLIQIQNGESYLGIIKRLFPSKRKSLKSTPMTIGFLKGRAENQHLRPTLLSSVVTNPLEGRIETKVFFNIEIF